MIIPAVQGGHSASSPVPLTYVTNDFQNNSSPSDPQSFTSIAIGSTANTQRNGILFVYQKGPAVLEPVSVTVGGLTATQRKSNVYAGGNETVRVTCHTVDMSSLLTTTATVEVNWVNTRIPEVASVSLTTINGGTFTSSGPTYGNTTSTIANIGSWFGTGMPDGAIAIVGGCNSDGSDADWVTSGTNWTVNSESYISDTPEGMQMMSAYYINNTGSTLSSGNTITEPDFTNDESHVAPWNGVGFIE